MPLERISERFSEKAADTSPVQFWNARFPIFVTAGASTRTIALQPANASGGIVVTPAGTATRPASRSDSSA